MKTTTLILLLLLTGCASTSSEVTCYDRTLLKGGLKWGDCPSSVITEYVKKGNQNIYSGVMYALPRQDAKLTIKREAITKATLKSKTDKIKEAWDAAAKSTKTKESAAASLEQQVKEGEKENPLSEAVNQLRIKHQIALLEFSVAKAQEAKLKANHKAAAAIHTNHQKDFVKDTFSITGEAPVPGQQRYVAQVRKSHFGSESIELKTTPSGLLSGGTGELKGQVDEIFVALAKAFASTQSRASDFDLLSTKSLLPRDSTDACKSEPQTFTYVFDPFDASEYPDLSGIADSEKQNPHPLVKLNTLMKSKLFCYELHARIPTSSAPTPTLAGNEKYNGLLYPRVTALSFEVRALDTLTNQYTKQDSLTASLIGGDAFGLISLDRSLFADNEYDFEFTDGLLTRYKSVTPSEILTALGMIPEAAKALIQIPAEILQLKVDYSSKESAYLQAEQAVIEARRSYEKVRDLEPEASPAL